MGAGWGALSRAHAGKQGLDFGRKLLGVPMADLPQVIDVDLLHRGGPTQLSQFSSDSPRFQEALASLYRSPISREIARLCSHSSMA